MRALVLLTSMLVIALIHALMLVPRAEPLAHVDSTEEIRTSHGGHHHKTMCAFTDDTDDDDDDDGDDDVLAGATPIVIAPMTMRPRAEIVFVNDAALGPASAHAQLLERPPRA